jgi:hypothetical protein
MKKRKITLELSYRDQRVQSLRYYCEMNTWNVRDMCAEERVCERERLSFYRRQVVPNLFNGIFSWSIGAGCIFYDRGLIDASSDRRTTVVISCFCRGWYNHKRRGDDWCSNCHE